MGCKNKSDRSRLMHENPKLWFAFELYCDRESGLRAIVEARILAAEPFSSIGAKIGFSGSVIETFALCFFDVHSRLSHPDFIHCRVLNQNGASNKGYAERELALKRIGYYLGPKALDRVLRTPGQATSAATEGSPVQGLANHLEDLLFDKIVTAIGQSENTDEKTVRSLMQVYAQSEAVGRNSSDASSAPEAYLKNVQAVLDEIPWKLASDKWPKELEPFQKYATELRAKEMLQIVAGQDGPTHEQMSLQILSAGSDPDPDAASKQ